MEMSHVTMGRNTTGFLICMEHINETHLPGQVWLEPVKIQTDQTKICKIKVIHKVYSRFFNQFSPPHVCIMN